MKLIVKMKIFDIIDLDRFEFVEEYQCVIEVWLWLLGTTRF